MATHLAYRVLSNIHTIIEIKAANWFVRAYAPIEIHDIQSKALFFLQFQERVGQTTPISWPFGILEKAIISQGLIRSFKYTPCHAL